MYKPFLISEFSSGLFTYLQPWITPRDSFTKTRNVYVNRGCLFSREGLDLIDRRFYTQRLSKNATVYELTLQDVIVGSIHVKNDDFFFTQEKDGSFTRVSGPQDITVSFDQGAGLLSVTFPTAQLRTFFVSFYKPTKPIRGIIPFNDQDQQGVGCLLVDDDGLCCFFRNERVHDVYVKQIGTLFNIGSKNFSFQIPWDFDFSTISFDFHVDGAVTTIGSNLRPKGSVRSISYDASSKTISGELSKDPVSGDFVQYTLYPDIVFKGFGNIVSWDISKNFIVISNGYDRVLFFDIINKTISKPYLPITEEALWNGTNQIATAKIVKFYKNRLMLLNNRIENAGNQDGFWAQSVRWSTPFLDQNSLFSHWNFVSDKPYGGEYSPDTNSSVVSCGSVKDKMVIWYDEDVYSMDPTNVPQVPFVFSKINSSRFATCSYTSTDLDTTTQIMGSYGFLQSDGVSVSRMDLNIPDFYKKIDFISRDKMMSIRFSGEDSRICTVFPSYYSSNGECDSILVYNFVENTFSEYSWDKPTLSCLGYIRLGKTVVWGDMRNYKFTPQEASFSFSSFVNRALESVPVAGGMNGELYALRGSYDVNYVKNQKEPFYWEFTTCRFAPYIQEGYASYFGFLDIYFEGFDEACSVVLDVFSDGRDIPSKTIDFVLDAPNGVQTFHRIQIQIAAQMVELRFKSNASAKDRGPLKIIGMILWAEKGGDIRNITKMLDTPPPHTLA